MAIVHQYTIIYFTLMFHESMSISINRDLCLKTVERFINHKDKCNFDLSTALDILQDVTTCPKKCSFLINDLSCDDKHSLGGIDLKIGKWKEKERIYYCSKSYPWTYLSVNCSSWNSKESIVRSVGYGAHICLKSNVQCVIIRYYCICHCLPGYILMNDTCLKEMVNIGGICEFDRQCNGTKFANVCDQYHGVCSCSPGYIKIDRKCYPENLQLNDPCELTEQCLRPLSVCFQEKCKCMSGYSAFNEDNCIKDTVPFGGVCSLNKQCTGSNNSGICEYGRCTCAKEFAFIDLQCKKNTVPVGGFCNFSKQCTGNNNSGICENGRCTCAKEFTFIDFACKKSNDHPNSIGIGSSISQQHDINIGVTLGLLFGGFILGVIVTAVVTNLMYRRLIFRTRKREEPDVMFSGNRTYGGASTQILYRNNKKRDVSKLSPYSFAKETPGYNSSENQDERSDDVYNHLHEQTEQVDDTYDHACAVPIHNTDLSDYSNIHDAAIFRLSPSKDGDDYSTLRY